jgi:hypothetical protein
MLWIITLFLVLLWGLGLATAGTMFDAISVLLVIAVVSLLIRSVTKRRRPRRR